MLSKREARELRDKEFSQFPPGVMDTDGAALYLQVSASTLNHWRSDGYGPPFLRFPSRGKGVVRYRKADIDAWLDQHVYRSTAEADAALSRVVAPADRVPDDWTGWSDWTDWRTWDYAHPYVMSHPFYVRDSAYADRGMLLSAISDPFALIVWMSPRKALEYPWVREDHRQEALALHLAAQNDPESERIRIQAAVLDNLWEVPEDRFGGHPLMTHELYLDRFGTPISLNRPDVTLEEMEAASRGGIE